MLIYRLPALLGLFICLYQNGVAQNDSIHQLYKRHVVASYKTGFIIPHREGIDALIQGYPSFYDFEVGFRPNEDQSWEKIHYFPLIGVSASFADFKNPTELGYAFGLNGFVDYPIIRTQRMVWSQRVALGMGLFSKKWNRTENYRNILIGSRINGMVVLKQSLDLRLNQNMMVRTGFGFTHFSNGAVKLPNLGINVPCIELGLIWNTKNEEFNTGITPLYIKRENQLLITAAFGIKETYPVGARKYGTASLGLTYSLPLGQKHYLLPTLDVFYNSGIMRFYENHNQDYNPFTDVIQSGVYIGYGFETGKLTWYTGQGFYYLSKFKDRGKFYHRIGAQWKITGNLSLQAGLKTHFFKADHLEIGINKGF